MAMPERRRVATRKLQAEIEELFADLWQVPRFAGLRRGFRPNVDSYHTDEPHRADRRRRARRASTRRASRSSSASARSLIARRAPAPDAPTAASTSRWRSSTARSSAQIRLAEDVDPDGATAPLRARDR